MNEIIPGIYRLQIPIRNNPLGFTNTYLVRGTDGWLLIDAGWNSREGFEAMQNQLQELSLDVTDIRKIIVTHSHGDHYGLVPALKERTDAEVILHRREKDILLNHFTAVPAMMNDIEGIFRRHGAPDNETELRHPPRGVRRGMGEPLVPDTTLEGGETISTGEFDLFVIWTPGHSPGHICLYEGTHKLLFGGDHVLPGITPNISLMPHNGDNPLGDFMKSLDTLGRLDVEMVLPAHEEPYPDLYRRIREIKSHHLRRNGEILDCLRTGPRTAYRISSAITWVPAAGGVRFTDLAPMDRRMALMETLSHLRAMEADNEITSFEEKETTWYALP